MAIRTVYRGGSPVLEGLRYRGREGMIAWLLHRLSGLGVLLFLVIHIFDIFLMGFGPGQYFLPSSMIPWCEP